MLNLPASIGQLRLRLLCCIIAASDEDCTNGFDDDEDGFVDCADPDCNWLSDSDHMNPTLVPNEEAAWIDTPQRCDPGPEGPQTYTWQDGNPYDFHCSYGQIDDNIPGADDTNPGVEGVCCPADYYAEYDPFEGTWTCLASDPCYFSAATPSMSELDGLCPFKIDEDEKDFFTDIDCFCPRLCVETYEESMAATNFYNVLPHTTTNGAGTIQDYCTRLQQ